MSQHVPQDLLAAFVEGDVGEHLAEHIADHLDSCPRCATVAASLEPLSAAFAALDDPEPPADLVAAVLDAAAEPDPVPVTELVLGGALLAAAAVVASVLGNPIGLATEFGVVVSALGDGARAAATGLAGSGLTLSASLIVVLAGLALTARLATPNAMSALSDPRRLS